jgi:hypothetical protein
MKLSWRLFFIASVGVAAFVCGAWFARTRNASSGANIVATAGETHRAVADKPRFAQKFPFNSLDDAVSGVFAAHLEEDKLHRAFLLYEALARIDSDQIAQLVEKVAGLRDSEREGLLAALLQRWQKMDPIAAEAWARPAIERAYATGGGEALDREILMAWIDAAPEKALAEALRRTNSTGAEQVARQAIHLLAGSDPSAQLEFLTALPAGPLRDGGLRQCLAQWAEENPAAAYAQIDRIPPGPTRDQARIDVLSSWAKADSAGALARLRELLPELQAGLQGSVVVNRVLAKVAAGDPRTAAEWAASLPEEMRMPATVNALNAWLQNGAVEALEWAHANGIPLDARGFSDDIGMFAHNELVRQAVSRDGEKVIEWLRRLPAGSERDRLLAIAAESAPPQLGVEIFNELPPSEQLKTLRLMAWSKTRQDPEAALGWARAIVAPEVRTAALTGVMREYSERVPSKVEAVLTQLAGPDRDAALLGCATSAAWRNPEQALALAGRIATPDAREQAFRLAAGSWLSQNRAAAEAWLSQTQELSPATKAYLLRSQKGGL